MPITKVNLLSNNRKGPHILENVGHSLIEQHLKQLADKPYNINVDHQQKKTRWGEIWQFSTPFIFSHFLLQDFFSPSLSQPSVLKKGWKSRKTRRWHFCLLRQKVFIPWNISIFNFTKIGRVDNKFDNQFCHSIDIDKFNHRMLLKITLILHARI